MDLLLLSSLVVYDIVNILIPDLEWRGQKKWRRRNRKKKIRTPRTFEEGEAVVTYNKR
jgi:hypothetical protein